MTRVWCSNENCKWSAKGLCSLDNVHIKFDKITLEPTCQSEKVISGDYNQRLGNVNYNEVIY